MCPIRHLRPILETAAGSLPASEEKKLRPVRASARNTRYEGLACSKTGRIKKVIGGQVTLGGAPVELWVSVVIGGVILTSVARHALPLQPAELVATTFPAGTNP